VNGLSLIDESGRTPLFQAFAPGARERYTRLFEDSQILILENSRALDRAYLAPNAVVLPVPRAEIDLLNFMTEGPFDPRREVLIEEPDARVMGVQQRPEAPAGGSTSIVEQSNTKVRVRVNSPRDQYLVLADAYYPGWLATVNGRSAHIFRANYLFRGVAVPAGASEVVFEYAPTSVTTGATITLATASGLVAIWIAWRLGVLAALATRSARAIHRRGGTWRQLPIPRPVRIAPQPPKSVWRELDEL
jgi:hypothetical protein